MEGVWFLRTSPAAEIVDLKSIQARFESELPLPAKVTQL